MKLIKIENAKIKLENRFYTIKELEEIVDNLRQLNEGKEKVAKMIRHRMPEGYEIYGV
jgi:cell division protein YceG involved in septum cleavage